MDNVLYWIWLTSKPVINPKKITSLLERFSTAEEIYLERNYFNIPNIGQKEIAALMDKSVAEANRIKAAADKAGAEIITFEDDEYPDKLRNIIPPPYILYVRGDITGIDDVLTVAVIGTRKHYTPYGKMVTMRLSSDLASNGAVVVSGLAEGLDGIAAEGALRAGGRTVAVMGTGIDIIYPARNKELAEEIVRHGAIITEYPPGSPAAKEHFPDRNRIIAGLSNGVLVTEAKRKSGTSITVRYAMEYGRDLFAVPGNINDLNYEGTNRYIQQGAKLTTNVNDILEEYPYAVRVSAVSERENAAQPDIAPETPERDIPETDNKPSDDASDIEIYKSLSEVDKRIVSLLMKKAMSIDELSRAMDMNAGALNVRLTLLEIKRTVRHMPGGIYEIVV